MHLAGLRGSIYGRGGFYPPIRDSVLTYSKVERYSDIITMMDANLWLC
jgi:hypothetical protein